MNINKAIRKQEKSNKRFLFFLGFIFFVMPIIFILSNSFTMLFLAYLFVIELFILSAMLININSSYLIYECNNYKLKIKLKLFSEGFSITCQNVVLVHSENKLQNMNIILLANSKFRSKKMTKIEESFLMQHPYAAEHYYKIKKANPENSYYYLIIRSGGYKKYMLLDTLYKHCTFAHYSDDVIERIKEYRKIK